MTHDHAPVSTLQALLRGAKMQCPHCGKARILRSYLKQLNQCPACHEDFSNIRADDAPPWLTILVTGHIIAPIILYCAEHNMLDTFTVPALIILFALLCCAIILPSAKGFFIAAIWLTKLRKNNPAD